MNIVLDSNILLHYKWFEDIPWTEEIGCKTVTLLLASVVVEEIDKVKDEEKGKVQKRAKSVSSKIGEILIDGLSGKYKVVFLDSPYASEEDRRQYNLDRNDNQILFAVMKSGIDTSDVCVVSSDNAMLMRAKRFGFKIHRIDEKYRIQEELTKEEKEAKAAIAELERIKNRLPAPKLVFDNNDDSNHIQILRAVPYDIEAVVRDKIDALKTQWPMKTIEDSQVYIMGQVFNTLTPENVISYNNSREEFLRLSEEKIRLETKRDDLDRRMACVSIAVYNSGTAPTGKMNIFLLVPDNVRLYEIDNKKSVNYNEPKTPNSNPLLNRMPYGGIYFPSVTMWDLDAYYKDNQLRMVSEPLTHRLKHNVFEFYIDSATCPNFKMQWYIVDAELIDPVKGELNISFINNNEDA